MCDQQSLRSACAYAQSDQRLWLSFEYSMTVKLLSEHHLEFLSLKGGDIGSSEPELVKMPHCWKLHVINSRYKLRIERQISVPRLSFWRWRTILDINKGVCVRRIPDVILHTLNCFLVSLLSSIALKSSSHVIGTIPLLGPYPIIE